ncbi:MAG: prepilin-type N-terminal cleavage/methylation domain-containing protein [bacterium]
MYYKQKQVGFTLLEMIVVLGIFSIVVVVISSILNSIFLSRKVIVAREKLQSDSNSIIEIISRDFRTARLYYPWYSDSNPLAGELTATNPTESLALIDQNGNMVIYRKSQNQGNCGERTPDVCLVVAVGTESEFGLLTWTNVTPQDVNLVDVKFYLEPIRDPFDITNGIDKQPLVAIILKTEAQAGNSQNKVSGFIQTSISSRFYQERY